MFGDVFETAEDIVDNNQFAISQTPQKPKPKNCAHFLDLPSIPRDEGLFIGLRNQGATCYLNSLMQALYMSPEFRNAVLNLPLCKSNLEEVGDVVPGDSQKFRILIALQKLFAEMQDLNQRTTVTEKVTESFGWNDSQELMQQDVQEANRVLFDVLERALLDTEYSRVITQNYRGVLINYLECLCCGLKKEREEHFYDMILQVKGQSSLEESLLNMLTLEKLEGSNQYSCDTCDKKVDAYKGIKIRKFPPILTFSLSRFEFDWEKMERKKIDDDFRFGLELDISMFAENPEIFQTNPDDANYELFAVLIHRGNAFGGHYHAYIRDTLKESDWDTKFAETVAQKQKRKEDKEKNTKGTDSSNKTQTQDKKTSEEPKESSTEQKETPKTETEEKKTEDQKGDIDGDNKSTDDDEDEDEDEGGKGGKKFQQATGGNDIINKKISKKRRNQIRRTEWKKNKKRARDEKNDRNSKKQKKEEKKDIYDDSLMDDVEFPIEFKNQELKKGWYDFNDGSVTAIPHNRIQRQFGGSNENAYILVYRQKTLDSKEDFKKYDLQEYLKNYINTLNELNVQERASYKEAEEQLEIITVSKDEVDFGQRKFVKPQADPTETGTKTRLRFDSKLKEFYEALKVEKPAETALVEISIQNNGLTFYERILEYEADGDKTIGQLGIQCWSIFIAFDNNDKTFLENIKPFCGEGWEPIRVNIRNADIKDNILVTYLNKSLFEFRAQIETCYGIKIEEQLILLMEGDSPKMIAKDEEDNLKTLKENGILDNMDIMLNKVDPEELQKQKDQANWKQVSNKKGGKKDGMDELLTQKTENITSVLVETDDTDGMVKYYVDLDWTLLELMENLKRKLDIDPAANRRLQNLETHTHYYEEEMTAQLRALGFEEGGTRLRIERGKVPEYGNLTIKVRNESKWKKEEEKKVHDFVGFPNEKIEDFKKKVCKELGLELNDHRFYQCDWLEEPVQALNKDDRLIKDSSIKSGDLLVLRDKHHLIPKEILKLNIHFTETGFPDNCDKLDIVQAKEEDSLYELKQFILLMPRFQELGLDPSMLRLRVLKKDGFFERIFKGNDKSLKKLGIETNMNIVAQILTEPEDLDDNTIVLTMRKRLVEYQTYGKYEEWKWNAPAEPNIRDLKKAFIEHKGFDIKPDSIEFAKFISYEFHWMHVNFEIFEKEVRSKRKKGGKKKKHVPIMDDIRENLRKSPYIFRDGDVIGYRLESENQDNKDDFQTAEDEEAKQKYILEKSKEDAEKQNNSGKGKKEGGGFQILTDF